MAVPAALPMDRQLRTVLGELVASTNASHCLEMLGETRRLVRFDVVGIRDRVDVPVAQTLRAAGGGGARFGWPAGFVQEWIERGHAQNFPVREGMTKPGQPFAWTLPDPEHVRGADALRPAQREAVRFMYRHGITAGLTLPVRRPFGTIGCVTWMVPHGADEHGEDERLLLSLIAERFFDAIDRCRLWGRGSILTSRETECLYWVANGRTDKEIARIIARSHDTVRFHMKSVVRKLNAVNRTHAVAIGVRAGLIEPLMMKPVTAD